MDRALQTVELKQKFFAFRDVQQTQEFSGNNYKGVCTRKIKTPNYKYNTHLQRSMASNDMRHGNRFFEYKPIDTRHTETQMRNEKALRIQEQKLYDNKIKYQNYQQGLAKNFLPTRSF